MNSDMQLGRVIRELPTERPKRDTQPLEILELARQPVCFAARRDVGRVRSNNEDHLYAMLTTLPRDEDDMLVGLFIVADGMGGHEGGEIASRMAIAAVVRSIASDILLPTLDGAGDASAREAVETALVSANRIVYDTARMSRNNMGTTCTTALLVGRTLTIGHIGDTRAYLVDPTGIRQLTSDHSAVGRLVALGQLNAEQAREHPQRSQLYRTVGQVPDVEVDLISERLGEATHLVLVTDGLWDHVGDEAIATTVRAHHDPAAACAELIRLANDDGGSDNISVIVVALPAPGQHTTP